MKKIDIDCMQCFEYFYIKRNTYWPVIGRTVSSRRNLFVLDSGVIIHLVGDTRSANVNEPVEKDNFIIQSKVICGEEATILSKINW